MASEFGNTSNAGLEILRNENKLGVWSLYQPDFIKAKRYIHKLWATFSLHLLFRPCYALPKVRKANGVILVTFGLFNKLAGCLQAITQAGRSQQAGWLRCL